MPKTTLDRLMGLIDGPDVTDEIRGDLVQSLYPSSFRIGTSILTSIVNGIVLAVIMGSWIPLA